MEIVVNELNDVSKSPIDDKELTETNILSIPDLSLEESEIRLRQKLMEKHQKKNVICRRTVLHEEEEMFTMQPGFQETKKKEAIIKLQKDRIKEVVEWDRQSIKEKERATKKPIEWKPREERNVLSKTLARSTGRTNEPPASSPSARHSQTQHRRFSPQKRRWEGQNDNQRRLEKHLKRGNVSHEEEEMFTMQPGFQEKKKKGTKKKETTVKLQKDRIKEVVESDRQSIKEKERATRKPIEWKPREERNVLSKTLPRSTGRTNEPSTSPQSARHYQTQHRRFSPQKRRLEEQNDNQRILEKHPKHESELQQEANLAVENDELTKSDDDNGSHTTDGACTDSLILNSPHNVLTIEDEELEDFNVDENESAKNKIKYSKFESSPEPDDYSDCDDENMSIDYKADDEDEQISEDELPVNLSKLEQKSFDDLLDTEKALLSPGTLSRMESTYQKTLFSKLPVYFAGVSGCRNVAEFESLNRIEEGAFGVVYRAIEKKTDELVALKRLKMENEREGFPITSLREINMLLKCGTHLNIVNLREIVVGSNIDKIYLVMEYVDHDIKALMETMSKKSKKFTIGQVKTLLHQLLSGVKHMHQEFVIHRDLKTSNLLLTRNGILKIGDFGLAREFGDPLKPYTQVVVTLWYRSPELLLGCKEYSTAVDMWSVGCIFAEFIKFKPFFPGRGEIDQLNKIFKEIGTPNEKIWPGYNELPGVKKFAFIDSPFNQLKKKFVSELKTDIGFELLNRLLAPCPKRRISAADALASSWFLEEPLPVDPSFFPTFPSKSDFISKDRTKIDHANAVAAAVKPVQHSAEQLQLMKELNVEAKHASSNGFSLKFDVAKF